MLWVDASKYNPPQDKVLKVVVNDAVRDPYKVKGVVFVKMPGSAVGTYIKLREMSEVYSVKHWSVDEKRTKEPAFQNRRVRELRHNE